MAEERVEWVRRAFEAWQGGDEDEVAALTQGRVAEEFEWHPLYLDRVYTGPEAMWQLRADLYESWQDYRADVERITDLGDHVLVVVHVTGRGPGSGVPVDRRIALLLAFRGEQMLGGRSFPSESEALEAAGLRE